MFVEIQCVLHQIRESRRISRGRWSYLVSKESPKTSQPSSVDRGLGEKFLLRVDFFKRTDFNIREWVLPSQVIDRFRYLHFRSTDRSYVLFRHPNRGTVSRLKLVGSGDNIGLESSLITRRLRRKKWGVVTNNFLVKD